MSVVGSPGLMVGDFVRHNIKAIDDIGRVHAIHGGRAAVWWDNRDPSWPLLEDITVVFE